MEAHDIKLHESVALLLERTEGLCDRLEKVDKKIDHLDECIDSCKTSLSFFNGKMAIVGMLSLTALSLVAGYIADLL